MHQYRKTQKVVVKNLPVKKPTQKEIALRIAEDENITILFREAQKIVGTFGYDTQSLLVMIYDYFGFSIDSGLHTTLELVADPALTFMIPIVQKEHKATIDKHNIFFRWENFNFTFIR